MDRHWRFARAEDKINRLSKQGLDMVAFWRACTPVLADTVPHVATPCCYTIDLASGLVTSHFQEGVTEFPPEWIAMEYAEEDVNRLPDVTRSPSGVSTLYEATGGNPSSSPRWHANMAYGADQEMIAAVRTRGGEVWGAIGLYREPDRPLFDADEQALAAISPLMGAAVRRALLIGESIDPEGPDAPGMIVLGPDWHPELMSPGVEEWLRDLPMGTWRPRGCLPLCSQWRVEQRWPEHRRPGGGRGCSGADQVRPLGRPAWCAARGSGQSTGCCDCRACASEPDRAITDVGVRPDGPRAAIDQADLAGLIDDGDR